MLKQGIAALSFLSLSVLTLPAFAEVDCSSAQSIDNARNNINSEITVKGLLTGDFTESLGGYFIQSLGDLDNNDEGGDDSSPSSNISRGIFVVANTLPNEAKVSFHNNQTTEIAVRGTVQEVDSQIRLNSSEAKACGASIEELPTIYRIPKDLNITDSGEITGSGKVDWGAIDWESLEGMRVTFAPMAITNLDKLATHGQLILSPEAWLDAPLQHDLQAQTKQAYNQNHQVIIDDGSNSENPDPLTLAGYRIGFEAKSKTLVPQAGAVFNDQHIEGIVYQDNKGYRIQATHLRSVPNITRSTDSSDVLIHNTSEILLAYLNLDHYFNGNNGDLSNSSGAQNNVEYQAQKQKIIAAINNIQADIIALTGLENDYSNGTQSTLAELASEAGYSYIKPAQNLGNDTRAVGLLYKPARVATWGNFVLTDNSVEGNKNRPSLIQTFAVKDNAKKRFTVAVTHLACDLETTLDDSGCTSKREATLNNLTNQLKQDPTKTEDNDFIIMGNFNAYAKDELITQTLVKGYTNQIAEEYDINTKTHYNSAHNGQWGTLDYILTSQSLSDESQIVDAGIWHINSREANLFDYRSNKPNQSQGNWAPDNSFYRFAKRDPLLIALKLTESEEPTTQPVPTPEPEPTPPVTPKPTSSGGGSLPISFLLLVSLLWIRRHLKQ